MEKINDVFCNRECPLLSLENTLPECIQYGKLKFTENSVFMSRECKEKINLERLLNDKEIKR